MKSLNYIGSKHTLLKTITEIININIGDTSSMSFMDLFAGTGVVGHNMLKQFKIGN
jgi:adenine-specific DNA methylase